MQALPVSTLATLAVGLGVDSRTKMAAAGMTVPVDTLLLAGILDRLSVLVWQRTKDGARGKNKPALISGTLINHTDGDGGAIGFDTAEDLMNALRQFDEVPEETEKE